MKKTHKNKSRLMTPGNTLGLSQILKQTNLKTRAAKTGQPEVSGLLFDNLINLETVSEILGVAPKTIHNWVYLRKVPYVKVGQKVMFRPKSLESWLNRKEIKPWL